MPRYFFNWAGSTDRHEGIELPGLSEAQSVALLAATEVIRHSKGEFGSRPEWHLVVTDETGAVVHEMRLHGERLQPVVEVTEGQVAATPTTGTV